MPCKPPGQPELEPELPLEDDDEDELLLLDGSEELELDDELLELLELEELDELEELLDEEDDDELELDELLLDEEEELGAQHPSPSTSTSHWQLSA